MLTSQGQTIKRAKEILEWLQAAQLPSKAAVVHVKAHQKEEAAADKGSALADREAKEAAKREYVTEGSLIHPARGTSQVRYRRSETGRSFGREGRSGGLGSDLGWVSSSTFSAALGNGTTGTQGKALRD